MGRESGTVMTIVLDLLLRADSAEELDKDPETQSQVASNGAVVGGRTLLSRQPPPLLPGNRKILIVPFLPKLGFSCSLFSQP